MMRSVARAGLVVGLSWLLAASLVGPAVAAPVVPVKKDRWPVVQGMQPVQSRSGSASKSEVLAKAAAMPGRGDAGRVVPAGEVQLDVSGVGARQRSGSEGLVSAGDLDVRVGPVDAPVVREKRVPVSAGVPVTSAGRVQVRGYEAALAKRLGVERVVSLTGAESGSAAVEVGTSSLEGVSGDAKARAVLVELPECAVTTPEREECRSQTVVESVRDVQNSTVTATTSWVGSRARVLAVAASSGGETGSYTATPMAAAGSWTAGGSSGDFDYKLPIELPAVPGSSVASVGVNYSAQSVDGRTAAQNNQTSWVGEGWDSTQGFIERKYKPCSEDQTGGSNASVKTGDLCWVGDNFTVALGSRSGELVQDGNTNVWRLRRDDGTRFEHLFGAFGNGDDNNEYWKMTTADGVQYFFGLGKPNPNGQPTSSTWTVPVFGNQPGEPCYNPTYANGSCVQAWRWNLDRVVDTRQGSMTIYYAAETNKYGLNNNKTAASYVRGGYPVRIEYGQAEGQEHAAAAPARVMFETAERCLPTSTQSCAESNLTASSKADWPDVPFDRICTAAACVATQSSPTFFTRKRLTQIRTEVWVGSGYQEVEHWNFMHTFPLPGDGYAPAMWLSGVSHGAPGMAEDPPITFAGDAFANRVEGTTDSLGQVWGAFRKYRIVGINNGMGGETLVYYALPDCSGTSLPAAESNTRRCYPVWWTPTGETQPRLQWFHKYVVTQVDDYDRSAASSGHKLTTYTYLGDPAWGWDDSPLTKDSERTWGRWVGYGQVKQVIGDPKGADSLRTETRFFRGLDQDRTITGGKRAVTVPDSQGGTAVDHRALQGMVREKITFNGLTGPEVSGTITDYTMLPAVATNSQGRKAERGVATHSKTRTAISTGVRWSESFTRYDSFGFPDQVDDRGDLATPADDVCSRTSYARNTAAWQLDKPATQQSRAVACDQFDTVMVTNDTVLAESRTFYDGLALGQIGRGDPTRIEAATAVNNGQFTYAATTAGYDPLGRAITATDVLGRTSTTSYTPTGRGAVTQIQGASPDPDGAGPLTAHTTTTTFDPRLGQPIKSVGVGGETTEASVDGYGRVTAVWQPGRDKASQTPSVKYSYTLRADGPNAVTTQTLLPNGTDYLTAVQLSDGLGRAVQTQTQSMDQAVDANGNVSNQPGRLIATNRYDLRGLVIAAQQPTFTWGLPQTTMTMIDDAVVNQVTKTTFDGVGRPTTSTLFSKNVEKWSTSTVYQGDRTHVTPPPGGTASTTITDGRGRTTAVRQYTGAPLSTSFDETSYTYTPAGKLKTHTDPAGNTWSYTYNLAGQQIVADDPDTGHSTRSFDVGGQLLTATNAKGETLAYTYDQLGRKTSLRDDNTTGTLRASFDYDTVKKGQATSTTRWIDGKAVVSKITGYDTASRPTGSQIVVPEIPNWIEAPLAKTYTSAMTYTPGGSPATTTLTNYGPLSFEKFTQTYDAIGRPLQLGGRGAYVLNTIYSGDNKLMQLATGNTPGHTAWMTYTYDEATQRRASARFDREVGTKPDAELTYTYNPAGNLTQLTTATPQTGAPTDTQCYTTDHLDRLIRAWTPATNNCATAPTATALGGPAPYWYDWTFDKASNRTSQTQHTTTTETTSTWTLPGNGTGAKPHQATSQTIRRPGQPDITSPLTYDQSGNLTTRTTTPGAVPGQPTTPTTQTLTYSREGRLDTLTQTDETIRFAYNTDGARLIRRDTTTTVLSLGDTELTLTRATGTITPQRYIQYAGQTIAMRTSSNDFDVYTLWSDLNNTTTWQVQNTTSTLTNRRTTPYGAPRDTTTLASNRGFVQGLNDPTLGMIRIGARDYDPTTGRFLQPDPILDTTTNPTQWNPYSYGNNNPTDKPDPTGLRPDDMDGEMYTEYLRGFRSGQKQGMSHEASQIYGNERAYNTPSGRSGGVSYKQRYGVRGLNYDPVKADRYFNDYRKGEAEGWKNFGKNRTNIWRPMIETYKTAFRPMNGQQIAAATAGPDSIAFTELLMTDSDFSEQMQAQAEVTLDIATVVPVGSGVGLGVKGASKAAANGGKAIAAANSVRTAAPSTFTRAEALSGRASSRKVDEIAASMRANGWQGAPIDVVELQGQRIVVDGHHRLVAARRAGIDVQYRTVDPSTVIGPGRYTSIDDILQSTYSVGRDRLR